MVMIFSFSQPHFMDCLTSIHGRMRLRRGTEEGGSIALPSLCLMLECPYVKTTGAWGAPWEKWVRFLIYSQSPWSSWRPHLSLLSTPWKTGEIIPSYFELQNHYIEVTCIYLWSHTYIHTYMFVMHTHQGNVLVRFFCLFVFSSWHKLGTSGKIELQSRKCLHHTGL